MPAKWEWVSRPSCNGAAIMTDEKRHRDYARVRSRGRAVQDEAAIREFLNRAPYGIVATAAGNQAFLQASTFVYDQ
jgi:hypothetical protein